MRRKILMSAEMEGNLRLHISGIQSPKPAIRVRNIFISAKIAEYEKSNMNESESDIGEKITEHMKHP